MTAADHGKPHPMEWNPSLYLAFDDHRLRPALDLIARVPLAAPRRIVDLGCGPGNVTAQLAKRWPDAAIVGVDADQAMLARARADFPAIEWRQGDIATWQPERPLDLIFSNAALHWLDRHDTLLPRLFGALAAGGALAVQMPRNFDAPSHCAIRETVEHGPWRDRLAPLLRPEPVARPDFYHRLLAPLARGLDIWETEYLQILAGDAPVVEWTRATALRPMLGPLSETERRDFEADYRARIARAYPPEPDGRTIFPFKRLFLIARH